MIQVRMKSRANDQRGSGGGGGRGGGGSQARYGPAAAWEGKGSTADTPWGARALLELTRALVTSLPVPVIVNDRADVALAAGAAGVHLGWDDPPIEALRPHAPAGFLFGLSVGSDEEAARARTAAPDYWSIGPCFSTATKVDAGEPLGTAGFARLARVAPTGTPTIGVGGITAANAGAIVRAGGVGIAVTSSVLASDDPEAAARALRLAVSAL